LRHRCPPARATFPHQSVPTRDGASAIVATASINATLGNAINPVYTAGKGGVLSLVRSLGDRLAQDGIRINSLSPGQIMTPVTRPVIDTLAAGHFEKHILPAAWARRRRSAAWSVFCCRTRRAISPPRRSWWMGEISLPSAEPAVPSSAHFPLASSSPGWLRHGRVFCRGMASVLKTLVSKSIGGNRPALAPKDEKADTSRRKDGA
jgi:NAD(P)-dependent dehydrogenase (short-subunit alcohol dehydrogenase family)